MEVNGYRHLFGYQRSSKYIILCSAEERKSYSLGEVVNDDRIFGWIIPEYCNVILSTLQWIIMASWK